jgi:hypothetical protein
MSRSWTTWSRRISLAEHSHSSFALTVVCRSLSVGDAVDGSQWEVQPLGAGFRVVAHQRYRVTEEGFHL